MARAEQTTSGRPSIVSSSLGPKGALAELIGDASHVTRIATGGYWHVVSLGGLS